MGTKNTITELVYDGALALRLAGQQPDLAADMLQGLLSALPDALVEIEAATKRGDVATVKNTIHKLHGLICYCGVPRLKRAAAALESASDPVKNRLPVDQIQYFSSEAESLLKFFFSLNN